MDPVKLEDIARELNISISTVSRAISGKGRVGARTRERVLGLVNKSGYRMNDVARSLRMKTARNMGIIVPDISNSFFASVVKGVQKRCGLEGYSLFVCNTDEDPETEDEMLRALLSKQVSGVVLASVGKSADMAREYTRYRVPIVYIDNIPQYLTPCDSVSIDNYSAARMLTLAMADRGFRDIGIITGPLSQSTGIMRFRGFEAALAERGLALNKSWVIESDFSMEAGYLGMKRVIESVARPRAMLFGNNYIAYGAIKALRERGFTVPGDMAVAAFDALDTTGLIAPRITSVDQPAELIGEKASDIIFRRLSGEDAPGENITLEPLFRPGDSW